MPDDEDQSWIKDDDRLTDIARDGFNAEAAPTQDEVKAMASELLHRRRQKRQEHRRADELRRMRWALENLLVKVEALERGAETEDQKEERRHG